MVAVKFWTAITFFSVYLQGSEMYPTCLRQTGLAMGAIGSNLTAALSPYIAYLVSAIEAISFEFYAFDFHIEENIPFFFIKTMNDILHCYPHLFVVTFVHTHNCHTNRL